MPPVRFLESRYGPRVRNGKPSQGSSYRSKAVRGSQRVDNAFAKRKRVYEAIERGDARQLQGLVDAQFGVGAPPCHDHMTWLFQKLKEDDVRYQDLSSRAKYGAQKRARSGSAPARTLAEAPAMWVGAEDPSSVCVALERNGVDIQPDIVPGVRRVVNGE